MSTIEAVQIFKKHYSDKTKPEKQKCKFKYFQGQFVKSNLTPQKAFDMLDF